MKTIRCPAYCAALKVPKDFAFIGLTGIGLQPLFGLTFDPSN